MKFMLKLKNNRFNFLKSKRILRDYTQSSVSSKINWLWLSGFIQGDGYFVVRQTRNEHILYVSKHINDIQILHKIKSFLGYGYVRSQPVEKMAHYVLQARPGILLALSNLSLFVGEKSKNYFKFLEIYGLNIPTDLNYDFISFKNAWLIGFIDAEGSFYGTYSKNKKMLKGYQLQLKFAITQKDPTVLKVVCKLFNIRTRYNKKGFYYFILSNSEHLDVLVDYVKRYPLLTKKSISFERWLKLFNIYKNKQHLDIEPLFLKKAVESINKFNFETDEDIVQSSTRVE